MLLRLRVDGAPADRRRHRLGGPGGVTLVAALFAVTSLPAVDRLVPQTFPTIQLAIAAANDGDRVLVDPGTYPERIHFLDKDIEVIGNFGAALTVIDAQTTGSVVTITGGQGASTRLQGFTLTGGLGQLVGSPPVLAGGGIYIENSHPTITGCEIIDNQASNGAGIYLDLSAAHITDCHFAENSGSEGAGITAVDSELLIEDCTFEFNTAYARGGGLHYLRTHGDIIGCSFVANQADRGGGLSLVDSDPELLGCLIALNAAIDQGGGVSLDDFSDPEMVAIEIVDNTAGLGGGMDISHFSQALLVDVLVTGNTSSEGGGLRVFESCPLLDGCRIIGNSANGPGVGTGEGGGIYLQLRSDPLIRNTIIAENTASDGGGLFCRWESEPNLTHVTIAANGAGSIGGGISLDHYSVPRIWNSIVHSNTAPVGPNLATDPESSFIIRFSDIEGGFIAPGVVDIDPELTADYQLDPCSPVIDMGSTSAPFFPAFDIDGNPRLQGQGPDMGAWESPAGTGHCFVRGDVNSDALIDLGDVTLTLTWLFGLGEDLTCPDAADSDDSGTADIADPVHMLSFLFLGGAPPPPPELSEPTPDPTPDPLPCDLNDVSP